MINSPELKVGLFVVTVAMLIGFMSLRVSDGPGSFLTTRKYWFTVKDAGGLVNNSAVKMAGIKVGVIDDIVLQDGQARVIVRVDKDAPVTASSIVELKSDGILGDKHVEIIPGKPGEEKLANNSEITNVLNKGSLGDIAGEIGGIAKSVSELAEILKNAASGDGDNTTPVGRIILNLERLTGDLAEVSTTNKGKINDIINQVNGITKTLDDLINDQGPDGFRAAWSKAVDSLSRVDRSLKNIEEITEKVNNGEGTIGRLINDESTVEKLNTAIDGVNEFVGGANTLETSLDFQSYALTQSSLMKSYLAVKIQPGLDRYYELGVVDDPKGSTTIKDTKVDTVGGGTVETTTTETFRNKLKFTGLFAKNFYNFTVKGGIIESAGGFGVDYYLMNRKLRFSMEAFNFSDTNLRASLRYNIMKGIFITAGGEELLDPNDSEAFFGGGLFLTNDDLKMFASRLAFNE